MYRNEIRTEMVKNFHKDLKNQPQAGVEIWATEFKMGKLRETEADGFFPFLPQIQLPADLSFTWA